MRTAGKLKNKKSAEIWGSQATECCQVLHTEEADLSFVSELPSGQFDKGNRIRKAFSQWV